MGTNRRAVQATMGTFLCKEIDQLSDLNISDAMIRRDIDRAPGGDPLAFQNKCSGCHSGMDPMSKAFAHFDFVEGALVYTPDSIPEKINRNASTFPGGYVVTDDSWVNLWFEGQNANLGWNGSNSGEGATEYGKMLASTDAFSTCMAVKVYSKVCLSAPSASIEDNISKLANQFSNDNFNMKNLFAKAATLCMGE
jgi:hypothetical protein